MKINKTQLDLEKAEERQLVHRDYIAHCLRWTNILKHAEIGETILDLGCADAPLAMAFYTNKYKPTAYVGIDIRSTLIEENKKKTFNFPAEFIACNIITEFNKIPRKEYSIIAMLEVIEHFEREYLETVLQDVSSIMSAATILYISTPCFNGEKANNHVQEFTFQELRDILTNHFIVDDVHGTFISQSDLKTRATEEHMRVFEELRAYYDSNLLSIIFAPLYPEVSRNCLWRLKKK